MLSARSHRRSADICASCRARKVRCDRRRPICGICARLQLSCSFDEHTASSRSHPKNSISTPGRLRAKQACLSCHRRKSRCDGETPSCARYTSLRLDCTYPSPISDQHNVSKDFPTLPTLPTLPLSQGTRLEHHVAHQISSSISSTASPSSLGHSTISNFLVERGKRSVTDNVDFMMRVFDVFFRSLHHVPGFAFLHRKSLVQRYNAGIIDEGLLLALAAVTATFADLTSSAREASSKWADDSEFIILQNIKNPSLTKIQGLALLIKHRMLTREFAKAFMLTAIAVRFAMALRLNYENDKMCNLARESRRRLMWSLFLVDAQLASGYRDFSVCSFDTIHIRLPCPERDFEMDLCHDVPGLSDSFSMSSPVELGILAQYIRVAWLRSKVLQWNKKIALLRLESVSGVPQTVSALSGQLEQFRSNLPESLSYSEANMRVRAYSPELFQFVMIHIMLHSSYYNLFRLSLPTLKEALPVTALAALQEDFVQHCRSQCFEHAEAVMKIISNLMLCIPESPTLDIDLAVCSYQALRLLFYAQRTGVGNFPMTVDTLMNYAGQCINFFALYPEASGSIRAMVRLLSLPQDCSY
jgi:hypothetical protein